MNKSFFKDLIYPIKINDFFEKHYNKEILILKNNSFLNIFSKEKINNLINNSDLLSIFFNKNNSKLNNNKTDNPLEIIKLSKYNFNLNSIEKLDLELEKIIYELEMELVKDIKINLYSFYKQQIYDNNIKNLYLNSNNKIILQLEGENIFFISEKKQEENKSKKSFYYYDFENDELNKGNENNINSKINIDNKEFLLEKGNLIYIPKGLYINSLPITETSLYIEILIKEINFIDIFIWIYEKFMKNKLETYNFNLSIFKNENYFENIKNEIINEIEIIFKNNDLLTYYFSEWLENKHFPYLINIPFNYNTKENYELILSNIISNKNFSCLYKKIIFIEKNDNIEIVLSSQKISVNKKDIILIKYLLSGNKINLVNISSIFRNYDKNYIINLLYKLLNRNILFFEQNESI